MYVYVNINIVINSVCLCKYVNVNIVEDKLQNSFTVQNDRRKHLTDTVLLKVNLLRHQLVQYFKTKRKAIHLQSCKE